jgi:hypothetical protein
MRNRLPSLGIIVMPRAGHLHASCGAAVAGALFLSTGLHSGKVGFTVELHDSRPPVDESWERVVEARSAATRRARSCWSRGGGHLAGQIAR